MSLLNFPIAKHTSSYYLYNRKNDGALEFTRFGMLEWLRALNSNFKPWAHLGESDLRNQLMHNLRGVEDSDVIEYLLGYPKTKPSVTNVMETYNNHVKTPFLEAIEVLKLPCDRTKLRKRLQEIVDSLV